MKKWVKRSIIVVSIVIIAFFVKSQLTDNTFTYKSTNPNAAFFYPLDTVPKIYLYRDVAGGLEEEFHRIYTVEDAVGPHLIVEIYASDGRLQEAINYNIDSLVVQDHMVVNRLQQKEKALLYKNQLFPFDLQKETWFATKFSGVTDSTVILNEVFRKFKKRDVVSFLKKRRANALFFSDKIRRTALNPFTRTEKEGVGQQTSVYAEGYGLVAWYNRNKSLHFRLERILSQKEWVKIITR
ncbi:MAG: hypothetical protein FJ349_06780 [Sphingomonadales bacterium]|nr:hypothetical protein [Sphingomonadales bacterium]